MNYQLLALLMISLLLMIETGLLLPEPFSSNTELANGEFVDAFDAVEAADAGLEGGLGDGDDITPVTPLADGESSGCCCNLSSSSSTADRFDFRLVALIDRLAGIDEGGGGGGGGGECNINTESSGLRRRHFFNGFMM